MELATGLLTPGQMQAELNAVLSFLTDTATSNVEVMYGFGCEVDEIYVPLAVPADALFVFINQSQDEGLWRLGEADFYITASDLEAEFLFCHESDVHITSENMAVLEFFTSRWLAEGYTLYQKREDEWELLSVPPPDPFSLPERAALHIRAFSCWALFAACPGRMDCPPNERTL